MLRSSHSLLRGVSPGHRPGLYTYTWSFCSNVVLLWLLSTCRSTSVPSGLRRGPTSALLLDDPARRTCTTGTLVPTTSVTLLREKRVGDAYDIEPLLAERSDRPYGPWHVVYRYLRRTFHLLHLGLPTLPSRLHFVSRFRVLSLEPPLAFVPSIRRRSPTRNLHSRGYPATSVLLLRRKRVEDASRCLTHSLCPWSQVLE